MSGENNLNTLGKSLVSQLKALESGDSVSEKDSKNQLINVAGVGSLVSSAYEQLRNAAEYSQDHLLIQNAIRRFFARNLFLLDNPKLERGIAEELIIELTQSGYLKNNSQSVAVIDKIFKIVKKYYSLYEELNHSRLDNKLIKDWSLDLISIGCESILIDSQKQTIFGQFAYRHYLNSLNKKSFAKTKKEQDSFEASLYIAVHKSLLESDLAFIRYDMNNLYSISTKDIEAFIQFNNNIDSMYLSEMTSKLTRYINRYGAPLRVIRSMIRGSKDLVGVLSDKTKFKKIFSEQVQLEYKTARAKLNSGLIKSIAFLLITKSLIGLAVEVPYDIFVNGEVKLIPLLINLISPVVYLAVLRLGIKTPGKTNAKAILNYAEEMFYGEDTGSNLYPAVKEKKYPIGFKIAYGLMFVIVFGLVTNLLMRLNFDLVQGVIFFIFLAAASFLGFRLSRIVKELELVAAKQGAVSTIRDFFFMPFTFLGKWISDKYQKVNIVALVLDTFIELPLKTVLRLIRQWTGFIDEKRDSF